MTKALEKAFEAVRALPDKDQDRIAGMILAMIEHIKSHPGNEMTQEIFEQIIADASFNNTHLSTSSG